MNRSLSSESWNSKKMMIINQLLKRNLFLEWMTLKDLMISTESQMKRLFLIFMQLLPGKWRFFNAQIWWNIVNLKRILWIGYTILLMMRRHKRTLVIFSKNYLKLARSWLPFSSSFWKEMRMLQATFSSISWARFIIEAQRVLHMDISISIWEVLHLSKHRILNNSFHLFFLYKWMSILLPKAWVKWDSNQRKIMTPIKWNLVCSKCLMVLMWFVMKLSWAMVNSKRMESRTSVHWRNWSKIKKLFMISNTCNRISQFQPVCFFYHLMVEACLRIAYMFQWRPRMKTAISLKPNSVR